MKKTGKILLLLLAVLTLVGCQTSETKNEEKEITKKCTIVNDQQSTSGYKIESSMTIYAKNDIVTKVETTEVVTSDQTEILSYFEDTLDAQYEAASQTYGGYNYDIKTTDEKLTSTVTIDYTEMNLDKYVEDYSVMKDYVNAENKLTVEGITKLYESMGATCEE